MKKRELKMKKRELKMKKRELKMKKRELKMKKRELKMKYILFIHYYGIILKIVIRKKEGKNDKCSNR